jgi:hypothetical protein
MAHAYAIARNKIIRQALQMPTGSLHAAKARLPAQPMLLIIAIFLFMRVMQVVKRRHKERSAKCIACMLKRCIQELPALPAFGHESIAIGERAMPVIRRRLPATTIPAESAS